MAPARGLPEVAKQPPDNDLAEGASFTLPTLPADTQLTLAVLCVRFGEPDEGCRAILLRDRSDAELVELGAKVDSRRIVDAVPVIVASVVRVLSALTPAQRRFVTIDPAMLGVIVHEAAALHALAERFDSQSASVGVAKASHAARGDRAHRDAMAERDVVRTAVAQVLGPSREGELGPARDASDDAALARGLDHLADVLDGVHARGTDEERAQLTRRGLTLARSKEMRALATELRATAAPSTAPHPDVTQRELDAQDGRVLVLLDALVDGMRAAHRASSAIAMPTFGKLSSRYRAHTRREKNGAAPAPTPDHAPASDPTRRPG